MARWQKQVPRPCREAGTGDIPECLPPGRRNPLPSLDNVHDVLLLNQHDEFRNRFKDMLTLQDGVPLRWGGEQRMGGFPVVPPASRHPQQRQAAIGYLVLVGSRRDVNDQESIAQAACRHTCRQMAVRSQEGTA